MSVDLDGIGAHYASAGSSGYFKRHLGLARSRRPQNNDQLRFSPGKTQLCGLVGNSVIFYILVKRSLSAQPHLAVTRNFEAFYEDFIFFVQYIGYFFDPAIFKFGDVQKPVFSRTQFNYSSKIQNALNHADVELASDYIFYESLYIILSFLAGFIVGRENLHQTVILYVYLRSGVLDQFCLLYTSPSPRDRTRSRMPSSA